MELKSVFEIVKADRYSQEGCDKINAVTEDKKYNTGDISQKTGLQKQPDGSWAPPKATKYGKVTTNKNGEVGIQQTLGKGSKFEKFADEKSASRALANLTAGYNTTERSKEDPHSDKARQIKHWDKETDQIRKENRQAEMKNEVVEYLSKHMPRENAEKFAGSASSKMLRTMYNNLKYKIPAENKALHQKVEQQHGKSTTSSTEIKAGTPVKVKVNGGREGTVKSVNGDIVTVEMPARGTSPARIDQYYKSDLEATAPKLTSDTRIKVRK